MGIILKYMINIMKNSGDITIGPSNSGQTTTVAPISMHNNDKIDEYDNDTFVEFIGGPLNDCVDSRFHYSEFGKKRIVFQNEQTVSIVFLCMICMLFCLVLDFFCPFFVVLLCCLVRFIYVAFIGIL